MRIIFLLFLCLFSLSGYCNLKKVYEHDVPYELKILIPGSAYKRYLNLLPEINNDKLAVVANSYKSATFKIFGSYLDKNRVEKLFSGSARITGDGKDHINNDFSSLNINLNRGNVGGIIKFRLLIPNTRQGKNEIFWSTFMEEMGYPVPYRSFVQVDLMGKKRIFIFEEKPEKEFLESFGIRESPVIEADERQIWALREFWTDEEKKVSGDPHVHQFIVKNKDFLKNKNSLHIAYRAIDTFYDDKVYKGFSNVKAIDFKNPYLNLFDEMNMGTDHDQFYAKHGLIRNNRKFIYDPIYNQYLPIYFDGDVWIGKNLCDLLPHAKSNLDESKQIKKEIIKNKFLNRAAYGFKFDQKIDNYFGENFSCLINELLHNYADLKSNNKKPRKLAKSNFDLKRENIKNIQLLRDKNINHKPPYLKFDSNKTIIEECLFNESIGDWDFDNCRKFTSLDKIKKYFTGESKPIDVKGYPVYPVFNVSFNENDDALMHENVIQQDKKFFTVPENKILFIKLNAVDSIINVDLKNITSKVIFYDSIISNSEIIITSMDHSDNENTVRYDTRLITSCATFIDSSLNQSKIISHGCSNEDAVNYIRSQGFDNSLTINDAMYDGFDSDFSDIHFKQIEIRNAGNDCFDVSSGIYHIDKAVFSNCGDKAVSVGEKSIVTLKSVRIDDAHIGVASKDMSKVNINDLNVKDVDLCLTAYQKKQEYGPGILKVNKPSNCNVIKKNNSIISNQSICKIERRNYFFSSCLTDNFVHVSFSKDIFDNHGLKVRYQSDLGDEDMIQDIAFKRKCEKSSSSSCENKFSIPVLQDKSFTLDLVLNDNNLTLASESF